MAGSAAHTAWVLTRTKAGTKAHSYLSPTLRVIGLASTMSTMDGGMTGASVPDAAITPPAKLRL